MKKKGMAERRGGEAQLMDAAAGDRPIRVAAWVPVCLGHYMSVPYRSSDSLVI